MLKTYSRSTKPREFLGELPVEYENACRLCLEKDDVMINIFGNMDIIPIVLKIRTCITIEVSEDDKLPNTVCQSCLSQLDSFYTFKKHCLATNVKLKQYIALPPSQPASKESQDIKEYLDLTLSEEGNEEDIKNACTVTWEEKQGAHVPIFEFPVSFMNNDEYLNTKNQTNKNSLVATIPMKTEHIPIFDSVNNAGYVSEDSMEDFAGFDEDSECKLELKKKLKILKIKTEQQEPSFLIKRGRGRPKKVTNPLQCRVCYKLLESEQDLSKHMLKHALKVKSCSVCQKTFSNRSMLMRHLRVHTGERPYPCDICKRAFSQKEILLRHKVLHSGERPYACSVCDRTYSLPEALKNHIRLHHTDPTDAPRYSCVECNKKFCHASGLSRHQLRHTGVVFSCTICHKVFTDSSSVKRHLRVHPKGKTNEKGLQYDIIKLELGEHSYSLASKTDTGETINPATDNATLDSKSYNCKLCSVVLSSKDELTVHYKNVHKEKRYKLECDHCNKTFRFLSGLERHQLLHKVNKVKEKNENVDGKKGLKLRPLEELSMKKRRLRNLETVNSSTEEDRIKMKKSKNKNAKNGPSTEISVKEEKSVNGKLVDGPSTEISIKEEKSVNGKLVDTLEEIRCSQEGSCYQETMLNTEEVGITVEGTNKEENTNSLEESKVVEIMDDSVEISIVPEETISINDLPEEIRVMSDELKKGEKMNELEVMVDRQENSKCLIKTEDEPLSETCVKKERTTEDLEKEIFG